MREITNDDLLSLKNTLNLYMDTMFPGCSDEKWEEALAAAKKAVQELESNTFQFKE